MEILDIKGHRKEKPKNIKLNWRLSVYALVGNKDGKFLMVMPKHNNQWELPGGGVDINESIKEALLRECSEETGYEIKLLGNLPIYVDERNFYCNPESKFYHSIIMIYPAEINKRQNDLDRNEIEKVEWLKRSELNKKNCHYIIWPLIQKNIYEKTRISA